MAVVIILLLINVTTAVVGESENIHGLETDYRSYLIAFNFV